MELQERFLLSLDDSKDSKIIKKILKSPLGLAEDITKLLFENKFDEIKENLDSIKSFVAGITRAEKLGNDYKITSYYPYLFSFHQFFHSSYRARQGKVLEEFIKEVIRKSNNKIEVADKQADKIKMMSTVFNNYKSLLDLDVIAKKPKKDILVIQLRSRDDTGGTTAKSSLVEALRDAMALEVKTGSNLVYVVSIWDEIKSNQKNVTIKKLYSSLKPHLKNINEKTFVSKINNGIVIKKGITLKLTYGTTELAKSLNSWTQSKNIDINTIKKLIKSLEKWDDLWLAYAIASIELENMNINKFNNITYLNNLLKKVKYNTAGFNKNSQFVNLADEIAKNIIGEWKEDSIPLNSPSEKVHYIRDLVLLKFIYEIS